MPKLLLINPVGQRSGLVMSRISRFMPLGLGYVAALTPSRWEVRILDENFDRFQFEEADLVGLTAFTSNINRAYEIASVYRRKGIKVILGGIHASMATDEALEYVDTVVTGEAEGIWTQVLEDFESNCLQRLYNGPRITFSESHVKPRRDLFHPEYIWQSVQTSRGCPFKCKFCSVSRYLGVSYRKRVVDDVLDELEEVKGRHVAFVDDNLIGYSEEDRVRAASLFRGMIDRKMNKIWWMQTSINASEDDDLIKLAAEAGCLFVFIGFESIDGEALKKMGKGINLKLGVENYRQAARAFHRHGIAVLGAFILGNDMENPLFYRKFGKFLFESEIDIFQITMLTPLPGTALMDQLQSEGRILADNFPADWDKYRFSHIVHEPLGVRVEDIYAGNNLVKKKLYRFPYYYLRLLRSYWNLKNKKSAYLVYKLNQAFRRGWLHSHYYGKY